MITGIHLKRKAAEIGHAKVRKTLKASLHLCFAANDGEGLNTVHARICTEKGVAMDTLYITDAKGGKIEDEELLEQLEQRFTELISRAEEATA